jgi:WD40 repeat protein/serine/threonine protein kinase
MGTTEVRNDECGMGNEGRAAERPILLSHRDRENESPALEDLVEEFFARLEGGERPDLEEFIAQHVQHADRLRRILPTMRMLADLSRGESSAGLAPASPFETDEPPRTLGDYQIIREIGRGGMGVVYEAEQISLQRRVALKILPFAAVLDSRHLQRFKNEALAAAHLDHPNIVEVYGVGCERGVHFYAMRYVEGQTLAAVIEALRLAVRGRSTLDCSDSSPLSRSKNGAHEINDEATSHSLQAHTERDSDDKSSPSTDTVVAALSTLRISRPCDFYRTMAELGIQAADALDHAHQTGIVHRDIKPSNLMLDAHGKLWVTDFGLAHIDSGATLTATGDQLGTLRYMSREQAEGKSAVLDHHTDIYSLGVTLYELITLRPAFTADDRQSLLNHILDDEPPSPRSVHSTIPVDLETIVLKCMAKAPTDRYRSARDLADDLRRFLENKPISARRPTAVQRLATWSRRHRVLVAAAFVVLAVVACASVISTVMIALERQVTETHRQRAAAMAEALHERLYAADIKLAHQAWLNGDIRQVLHLLERHRPGVEEEDLRGFEWRYLWRLGHSAQRTLTAHSDEVHSVAFSPEGRLIASGSRDGSVKVWDATKGETIWSLAGHRGDVYCVAFSPDGKTVVSAGDDTTARLWQTSTGRQSAVLHAHTRAVFNAVFSPDGRILATAGKDSVIRLWDTATLDEKIVLSGHLKDVEFLAFSPDGTALASVGDERPGLLKLWDVATGREKLSVVADLHPMMCVAFSPDGATVATASEGRTIKLWDAASGVERLALAGHAGSVESLAFSPNGKTLASASTDATVRLWDVTTGRMMEAFRGHIGRIRSVAFSPDGRLLASAGGDQTVKQWDPTIWQAGERRKLGPTAPNPRCFSVRGATLVTHAQELRSIRLINLLNGEISTKLIGSGDPEFECLAMAPRSGLFAVSDAIGQIELWDSSLQRELLRWPAHEGAVGSIAFSPNGRMVASGGATDSKVKLWDVATGNQVAVLQGHKGGVRALAFSLDGQKLASASNDSHCKLWDLAGGELLATYRGHREAIHAVTFSSDGALIATAGNDETVRLWKTDSSDSARVLRAHSGPVYSLAFSTDGKTLASGGDDGVVRLWSVRAGQELLSLEGHFGPVQFVAFQNSSTLLSVATKGWPAAEGELILWSAAP